ncbi:MAG: hypothetical protein ACYCW6_31360, partial [Candidatus Xenobia bacterium]
MIAAVRHLRATPPAPSAAPPQDVEVSYNPQDSTVMDAQPIIIHGVSEGPQTDKVKLKAKLTPVNGQYVYDPTDAQYHGAVSFATVNHTIDVFSQALGHPIDWAFRGKLGIKPDDGKMLNAYYQRFDKSLHFFHDTDKVSGQTVYSADSGEVVSHETGHAMLDGLRPAYMESWSPDPAAFHESFGDVMALMVALQDDRVLDRVVQQTGGDLSKPNIAANLGEQLGVAINDNAGKNVTGGNYTRTAINDFTWQDPSTLPDKGDATHLGSEAHSFSRLWTGAIYKVLTGMVNENLKAGQAPKDAIKNADTELLKLYANLFKTAPEGDFT